MNYFALSALLTFITTVSLSIFVLFANRRNKINQTYAFINLSIAVWSFFYFFWQLSKTPLEAIKYLKLLMYGATFMPISLFHFMLTYLNIEKQNKKLLIVLYMVGIFFVICIYFDLLFDSVSQKLSFPFWPNAGKVMNIYLAFFFGFILYAMYKLYIHYIEASGITKTRIIYLFIGLSFAIIAGSPNYFLWYDIPIPPILNPLFIVYVGIIAYAILRHRLMDIEVVIKKGIIYSTLMAFIIGVYSLLMFIGQNIFQTAFGVNQWIATIVTAFAIAVGYKPLESFITDITNQYFFRKKYDYQATLKQSSEAMNLLTDIDRLVRLTTRIVARRMELIDASTLIYDEIHHRYIVKAAEGKSKELLNSTFSDNYELFRHLFTSKQMLIKDEVTDTLNSKLLMPDEKKRLNTIKKEMEKLHAQLCVPCITRGKYMGNKLVAVFCMGEKKSGDMFTNDDIQLLSTLSNQAAVAVENAIMYSDLMSQFKELKETKDQLVQSEKLAALGTMAAGIAHEIRNPLTSLQLFVTMMAERFDDHEFREKFTQIVPPEVERLNRIVNDLVSFAKPSKLTREPSPINDILEKTIRLSEISFKKLNVKIVRELGDVPKVLADSQQIMQIFLNLLMNGAQAMKQGGTMTVRSYFNTVTGRVAVDIRDTGSGISEENMKKLFSPFFTTKDGGTGLGLAITKRIVEEHKGEIRVKSKVGEGTVFTVELPVAAQ